MTAMRVASTSGCSASHARTLYASSARRTAHAATFPVHTWSTPRGLKLSTTAVPIPCARNSSAQGSTHAVHMASR
jgi:hypothetical protein